MKDNTADTLTSLIYFGDAAVAFAVNLPLPGIGFAVLGVGSTLFHYYEPAILEGDRSKKWAQRLDEVGMMLAFVPLMVLSLEGNTALLITASALFALLYEALDSFYVMPTIIGIGLIAFYINFSSVFAVLTAIYFLCAVIARFYINHSTWHIISVFASGMWIYGLAML